MKLLYEMSEKEIYEEIRRIMDDIKDADSFNYCSLEMSRIGVLQKELEVRATREMLELMKSRAV